MLKFDSLEVPTWLKLEVVRVKRKGQVTIPAEARRKYGFEDGSIVVVEEREEGLLLKRAPDIITSAGALSECGEAKETIRSVVKSRTRAFR